MRTYPVKTPGIVKRIFGKYRWQIHTGKKEIYLTFDDGPIPEITSWVLQNLSQYDAKATFFCIGENVKKHPKIFQKIVSDRHSIGNHTNDHLNGWKTGGSEYIDNIEKAEGIFRSQIADKQKLTIDIFRPPYGKIKTSQANRIIKKGYDIIMWDVLSGDFDQSISKEKCLKNVLKNTNSGSIVVFHDSKKAFKKLEYVLPKTLEYFTNRGYEFKGI